MRLFDGPLFDINGDGREDFLDTFIGLQQTAESRREALELTGDDSFYLGDDSLEDDDEFADDSDLDMDDLEDDDWDSED